MRKKQVITAEPTEIRVPVFYVKDGNKEIQLSRLASLVLFILGASEESEIQVVHPTPSDPIYLFKDKTGQAKIVGEI